MHAVTYNILKIRYIALRYNKFSYMILPTLSTLLVLPLKE